MKMKPVFGFVPGDRGRPLLKQKENEHKIFGEPMKRKIFGEPMKRLKSVFLLLFFLPSLLWAGTKVLFIGDSITDGAWGSSGGGAKPSAQRTLWDMNHIYGHGYMYLCAAHYQGKYPSREYEFFNRGISGNTLEDLEKRWQMDVLDINPDVLSVLIGTNDIDRFLKKNDGSSFDFKEWETRYRKLLDTSLAKNPHLKLILCAPFVANTGNMRKSANYEKREALIHECAEVVERIAKDYKAIYLPYGGLFDDLLAKTPESQSKYWIWDGIHPTAAGHRRMADMWIKAVNKKKLLKR